MNSEVQERAARIKLLLMDCDGVLTDGRIWPVGRPNQALSFSRGIMRIDTDRSFNYLLLDRDLNWGKNDLTVRYLKRVPGVFK